MIATPFSKISHAFQEMPLGRKFFVILLITSGLSLLFACSVLVTNDVLDLQQALVEELSNQAGLVGENSSAALAFEDQEAAHEILTAFQHQSHILQAILLTPEGKILAQYKPGPPPSLMKKSPRRLIWHFSEEYVEIYRTVSLNHEPVGTIYLRSSFQPVYERLKNLLGVTIVAMILSCLLSLIISTRLQQVILRPLVHLTNIATRISQNKDYSLRASTQSPDEIGILIDKFNDMLQEIQDRDKELERHRSHLSEIVQERTAELSHANTRLQEEIHEREAISQQVLEMATDLKDKNEELAISRDTAMEAAKAKSDFLAAMSHEIRTPMNGILGMTGLLLDTELTHNQRYLANTVQGSAEALLSLLNDILDFSKIEAGKLELETLDFDLRATIENCLDLLAERAAVKHLELTGLIFPDVPTHLRGDPGRLRQILLNLLGNAIKFTDQGEVTVQILLAEDHDDHVELRFHVWDTGMGIPPEVTPKLFQAFTQADSSTTRKYGGTGLGLAICQQLVNLMGGQIGVESQPSEWSLFWFSLPFHKPSVPVGTGWTPRPDLHGIRVCCIDDNQTNLFLLQSYTKEWGMDSCIFQDPEGGFQALKGHATESRPFDIAIVDRKFPTSDGLELGRRIKDEPLIAGTKLVLLTSVGEKGEASDAQKAGFDAYLPKPIHKRDLHDILATALGCSEDTLSQKGKPLITRHLVNESRRFLRKKILIADDHTINQQLMVLLLEKLGYASDVVQNGQEAVEAFQAHEYDLVLMDCQMPQMDGFDATRRIRELEEQSAQGMKADSRFSETLLNTTHSHSPRIPIIALTANAMPGDREQCLQAGMDDYLSKPVSPEDLSAILTQWLSTNMEAPIPANSNRLQESQPTLSSHPDEGLEGSHFDRPATGHLQQSPMNVSLDPGVIQVWLERGGPDRVGRMVEEFIQDLHSCLSSIENALDAQAPQTLARAGQGLKGICENIGAARLAALAHELEQLTPFSPPIDPHLLMSRLWEESRHVTMALGKIKEGNT